jgi:hypothetical protein
MSLGCVCISILFWGFWILLTCIVEIPNDALKIWYNLFNEILNKHAPIVTKRVKRDKQPEWYNTEVQYARQMRDTLIFGVFYIFNFIKWSIW